MYTKVSWKGKVNVNLTHAGSKYRMLFLILFVFFVSRVWVMLTSMDTLFDSEDLAMGVLAKEVMKGPALPLFEYQYLPYSGGTLVVGLLAIPFFMLLGPNYFALKLVPFFFSGATLAVLFLFAYKFFGRRAAVITALLYLFSSTAWGGFNFFLGFHTESLLFTFLAVYLFYEIVFNHKQTLGRYLLFGIIAGFGTYFSYTLLVALAALFLVWFIHNRKLFKEKGYYIFCAGFLIGFVPWLIYNFSYHFRGVTDVASQLFQGKHYFSLESWVGNGFNFLRSLWFPELLENEFMSKLPSKLYGDIYCGIYWLSFFYIVLKKRKSLKDLVYSREFFILIFPFMLVAAARLYGMESEVSSSAESRYLMGLFPFVFLTVGIGLDAIFEKRRFLKIISAVIFPLVVIAGAIGFLMRVNYAHFGNGFKTLGYSYYYLAETFNFNHQNNFYKILDNITKVSEPERYEVLTLRLSIDLSYPLYPVSERDYLQLQNRLQTKYRPFFHKILIKGLYYNSELDVHGLIDEVKLFSQQVEDIYKPFLYEGVGALMVKRYPDEPARYNDAIGFVDKQYLPYYYRGLSEPIYGDDIPNYIQRCKSALKGMDVAYIPAFLDGMGEVLAKFAVATFMVGLDYNNKGLMELYHFFDDIQPPYKKYLFEGAGKALSYFYTSNTDKDIYAFINYFKVKERLMLTKLMLDAMRQ